MQLSPLSDLQVRDSVSVIQLFEWFISEFLQIRRHSVNYSLILTGSLA